MNTILVAFGIASVILVIGILLRAKTKFFQNILMPASVIGGIVGLVLINICGDKINFVSTRDFASIVDQFFVFSFITIGLSNKGNNVKVSKEEKRKLNKKEKREKKNNTVLSGAISLGLVWSAIYGIQAFTGGVLCKLLGGFFNMSEMYGILISFGFSQGPGQSSTYGQIFEKTYGYEGAEMVAIAFAVVGFLAAFLVGVPLARYGIEKHISNREGEIGEIEKRGYYKPFEEGRSLGRATTYGGNIETITTHLAFIGISYLGALGFSWAVNFVPGIGESFAAMKFFWGMLSGTIIRRILGRLNIDYILDDMLLSRITAFLTDYVIVTAFMSVKIAALGTVLIPIIIVSVITTLVTFIVSVFFCQRMGSDHDFEKLLGLFGTSTGTASSGISLLRIVDPMLKTSTAQELGCINIVGILSAPIITFSTLAGTGAVSINAALIAFLGSAVLDIVLLFITGGFNRDLSFSLFVNNERKIKLTYETVK